MYYVFLQSLNSFAIYKHHFALRISTVELLSIKKFMLKHRLIILIKTNIQTLHHPSVPHRISGGLYSNSKRSLLLRFIFRL